MESNGPEWLHDGVLAVTHAVLLAAHAGAKSVMIHCCLEPPVLVIVAGSCADTSACSYAKRHEQPGRFAECSRTVFAAST